MGEGKGEKRIFTWKRGGVKNLTSGSR